MSVAGGSISGSCQPGCGQPRSERRRQQRRDEPDQHADANRRLQLQVGLRWRRPVPGSGQSAITLQGALSSANADQTAVNANVPVNIGGGNVSGGNNSANQGALNGAGSLAGNNAGTNQTNTQSQTAGSDCKVGCGGAGQAQLSGQQAVTGQLAGSSANANQTAVNANVPVNIGAGNVSGGDNSANQLVGNGALSGAGNNADTNQTNTQSQTAGSDCKVGCGGAGQAQRPAAATLQRPFRAECRPDGGECQRPGQHQRRRHHGRFE